MRNGATQSRRRSPQNSGTADPTAPRHVQGPPITGLTILEGEFDCECKGESHYQDALLALFGPKTEDGCGQACIATLVPEPSNPHDPNAVMVQVDGHTLGYVNRATTALIHERVADYGRRKGPCLVRARIVGGWERSDGDEGTFGIWLRLPVPSDIE